MADEIAQQMERVEEYVRFAEGLPTDIHAVKVYLGYDTTSSAIVSPAAMQELFMELKAHAGLWRRFSAQASDQLRELALTADSVVKGGAGLLRGLEALGPVSKILNTVSDAAIASGDFETSSTPLDESTIARINRLAPYVDSLKGQSLDSLGDTDATTQMIADFRTSASGLEAKVSKAVDALKDENVDLIGNEKTVGPTIDAFREACARITSELGEGSKAAIAVQRQISKTLAELTGREADLQKQQRLTYAVGRLFVHLQGLGYAMLDSQSALTHLWFACSEASSRLQDAASDTASIETEDTLLEFYITYKQIDSDWASIRDDASSLYKAF